MAQDKRKAETLALHAGYRADTATGAVAPPIYQTTAYQFEDTDYAASLFALTKPGNIYTRLMNPTTDILEKRMAAIEGGSAALALASGQAASFYAVLNLCSAGDNFVTSTDLYGGTWNLFSNTFAQLGIEARFVDPADPEAFRRATDDKTRCYYAETVPNPKLKVFPIREVAAIGRSLGVPLIVDNTCAPLICRPFELGAAVVIYSATKFLGGHGTSMGGLVIESGTFDWTQNPERFPTLNTPDPSYHGLVWTEATKPMGPVAYVVRIRTTLLRDTGAVLSPFNSFQILQGVETLALRMRAHCDNAQKVAEFLASHPQVASVTYPSLQTGEDARRRDDALSGGYGSLLGFELKGGAQAGKRFIEALKMFYHVANIGDARSLAIHPATTTQSQLSEAERLASGVSEGYVRLSIGIEHIDDILADLKQALEVS
ncbi:PLP-dependent transferase [Phaeovibrio sulfidiphilus]|uniref:PLP-dependent transferase n=1 Tax=Phaeovibrio sulfidiphilus TaxID=1220600 RepID=A0A8J7CEA2_9PROT|nr:PLP-dependent transferase [Phaeovibrio sulfidiphilus]MBE1237639.1 PLP-dependent transferase [Phaeovibrio sulfidiphilus]